MNSPGLGPTLSKLCLKIGSLMGEKIHKVIRPSLMFLDMATLTSHTQPNRCSIIPLQQILLQNESSFSMLAEASLVSCICHERQVFHQSQRLKPRLWMHYTSWPRNS